MASITEKEFQLLIAAGAVRRVKVVWRDKESEQDPVGEGWTVWAVCGTEDAPNEMFIRTKREPIQIWESLDYCSDWLDALGIMRFEVEQTSN